MGKLKMYCGNYDGRNGRAVVTTSQKRAAELIGVSISCFRDYFNSLGDGLDAADKILFENPEVVFKYKLHDFSENRYKALNDENR